MLRSSFAAAAVMVCASVLAADDATRTFAETSTGGCPVPQLPRSARAAGVRRVAVYHRLRLLERRADLMGFREGPRLPPPSRKERRDIRASRAFRHSLRLNESVLLIRRLLRTHGHGIDPSGGGSGVPLTRIEVRDLSFRRTVEVGAVRLTRFQRQCAGGSAAGLYLSDRRAGVLVTARFTTGIRARRRQLLRRFPYAPLLNVVHARFSLRLLKRVRDRVVSDIDYLETQGIRLGLIQVDVVRNRVVVHLHSSRNDARPFLSHRYGPALLIRAHDTTRTRRV